MENQLVEYYDQNEMIECVENYLQENGELRSALGISGSSQLEVAPLGHGEHNANFLFRWNEKSSFVFRICRENIFGFEHPAPYEREALELVAPTGHAPSMLFMDTSHSDFDGDVSVLTYCPGRLSDFRRPADLAEIAQLLADIHSVPVPEDRKLRTCEDMVPDLMKQAESEYALYSESSCVNTHLLKRVGLLFDLAAEAVTDCPELTSEEASHLLHCEPIFDHFVIDDEGTGKLIDWETAGVGEVARDVAGMLTPTSAICGGFLFDRAGMDAFIESYWKAVDGRFNPGTFFKRLPACEAVEALRGITWALKTTVEYEEGSPAMRNAYTWHMVETYLADEFLDMIERDILTANAK